MAEVSPIQIRYAPVRSYANTQDNYIGAQAVAGRRGTLPTFTNANTRFVKKTGSDSGAGTLADPYLTIGYALSQLTADFVYACVYSGTYDEVNSVAFSANAAGGLYVADGESVTITKTRGAVAGTFGARRTGRTKFYTGAKYYYVAKNGNDGTGVLNDPSHPYLTIQAAANAGIAAAVAYCIQIQDDGTYVEDIDLGAIAATIQARDAYVPVLTTASGAGGTHLTAGAGVAVNLYGLTFRDPVQATGYAVKLTGDSDIYDCTFTSNAKQITLSGTKAYNVVNCMLSYAYALAIGSNGGTAATSVAITNCTFYSSVPRLGVGYTVYFATNPTTQTVTRCTFENDGGNSACVMAGATSTVDSCIFRATQVPGYPCQACSIATGLTAATIINCLFEDVGERAIGMPVGGTPTPTTISHICCSGVASNPALAGTFDVHAATAATNVTIGDAVFLRSFYGGIRVLDGVNASRCVAVNAGQVAYSHSGCAAAATLDGCIEYGSGLYSVDGGTSGLDVTDSVFSSPTNGSPALGAGYFQGDPRLIGVSTDAEVVAVSASSPVVASIPSGAVAGPRWPLLTVTAANHPFVIDGFTITGDKYFNDGILVTPGVNGLVTVSHCTVTDCMGFGMWLDSGASASACYVNVNGLGAVLAGGVGTVSNCVFDRCGSAGVFVGTIGPAISHVTAYGCEYGQYDFATGGGAAASSNVLSGNGAADYSGSGDQAYSLVGRIVGGGTVTNGVQGSPLFRDLRPSSLDLRLQAVEYGYAYDSPAKALAADGSDAGAYDITYGALTLTWTLLDFATATYINVFDYLRTLVVLKATRTDTFGGNTQVSQAAIVARHTFRWPPNAHMPDAQVLDLKALFSDDSSETQLSFDAGATWTTCRMEKDTPPTWAEIAGLWYTAAGVPTPIDQISFIESA